jgi:hypothetical protein
MKKIICLFIVLITLNSCSNSSKIENKYWIEQNEYSPEILLFKNGIMSNMTKNESITYEIKDNFINAQKGNTTTKIEIKELTNDILTLIVDNKIISYKEAKDSDFILGSWKSREYKIDFDGNGSFTKATNTLALRIALRKKTFSTDYEKNAILIEQAITKAQEFNEDGTYSYNNNALTLNDIKYEAKLSEDKKELQIDFKDKKILFKRD